MFFFLSGLSYSELNLSVPFNDALSLKMGGSGSKAKGVCPFAGSGTSEDSAEVNDQSFARMCCYKNATPFVFTRRRYMLINSL